MKFILRSNYLVIVLIIISSFITFYYMWNAAADLRRLSILDRQAEGIVTRWQINEKKGGKYFIGASYEYDVDGSRHEGVTIFSNFKFLNYYAALDMVKKLSKDKLKVWYSSKNTYLSTLEYRFSAKNTIYFVVSFFVLLYFLFLTRYIKNMERL